MKVATFTSDKYCYLFFDGIYVRATKNSNNKFTIDDGYPLPISVWGWGDFGKEGIDAAYEAPGTNKCYFFCDNRYIRVTRSPGTGAGTVDPSYPKAISEFTGTLQMHGFGNKGYDAILPNGNKIYFFVGNQYGMIRYDGNQSHLMDSTYPRFLSDWGLPTDRNGDVVNKLDATLCVGKDQFYFFFTDAYTRVSGVPTNNTCPSTTHPIPVYEFDNDRYEPGRPTVEVHSPNANWLSRFAQQDIHLGGGVVKKGIDMPISDINLPGTHDSAAIQTGILQRIGKVFFNCQRKSITDQLFSGVRLLDIRLAIRKKGAMFEYMTCHGNLELILEANIYQSFDSVMEECLSFLMTCPDEFIVMSLKVDYWRDIPSRADREKAIDDLYRVFFNSPLMPAIFYTKSDQRIPTYREVKGKIVILDRILMSRKLGLELNIRDNLAAGVSTGGLIEYQDKYEYIGTEFSKYHDDKLKLVSNTIRNKKMGVISFNFASAVAGPNLLGTNATLKGIDINEAFLNKYDIPTVENSSNLVGWILFDFALTKYPRPTPGRSRKIVDKSCVDYMIEVNFR